MRWFHHGTLALFLVGACGPKDVIPASPRHPANPEAAAAQAPAPTDEKQGIAAAEQAAYEKARPVFAKHCAKCHTSAGAKASKVKLDHFSMDSYPFGGHHAAEAGKTVRLVLGAAGKKATMPADSPGAVQGEELQILVEWSHAFDASHAAGLHDHGDHGHH